MLVLYSLSGCQKDVGSIRYPIFYDEDKPDISAEKLNYLADLTFLDNSGNISYEAMGQSCRKISINFCENAETCDSICFYWSGAEEIENFFNLKVQYELLSEYFNLLSENISVQDKRIQELLKISLCYFELANIYRLYGYEWLKRSMEECGEAYIQLAHCTESNKEDSVKITLSAINSLQTSFSPIFQIEKKGISYEMLLNEINSPVAKNMLITTKDEGVCPKCKTPVSENSFIQYEKVRVFYEYYLSGVDHKVYKQWEGRTPCHFFSWCSSCKCKYEEYLTRCTPSQTTGHICGEEKRILISSNVIVEDGKSPPSPTNTVVIINITTANKSRSARSGGLSTKSNSCPCINCEPDPDCHEGGSGS
jgi:hypothetical protein